MQTIVKSMFTHVHKIIWSCFCLIAPLSCDQVTSTPLVECNFIVAVTDPVLVVLSIGAEMMPTEQSPCWTTSRSVPGNSLEYVWVWTTVASLLAPFPKTRERMKFWWRWGRCGHTPLPLGVGKIVETVLVCLNLLSFIYLCVCVCVCIRWRTACAMSSCILAPQIRAGTEALPSSNMNRTKQQQWQGGSSFLVHTCTT